MKNRHKGNKQTRGRKWGYFPRGLYRNAGLRIYELIRAGRTQDVTTYKTRRTCHKYEEGVYDIATHQQLCEKIRNSRKTCLKCSAERSASQRLATIAKNQKAKKEAREKRHVKAKAKKKKRVNLNLVWLRAMVAVKQSAEIARSEQR